MSKQALQLLLNKLNESDPRKEFRNKIINPQIHGIDTRETSITAELRAELKEIERKDDPEIFKYIKDPEDLKAAAERFRAVINGFIDNPKTGVTRRGGRGDYITGTFSAMSTLLQKGSEAAVNELFRRVATRTVDYIPFFGKDKLFNLDHTNTVGETRIAGNISDTKINPFELVKALKGGLLTKKEAYQESYTKVLEAYSYYSADGSKNFEIKGTIETPVIGSIRSGRVNQREGTQEVAARVKAFKKAIELAIKDVDFPLEVASDSFVTATNKRLNNAVVKAGGSGTIQKIDDKPSKAKSSKTVKQTQIITGMKGFNLKTQKTPRAQASKFSLQAIVNYINSRLTPALKANMGSGAPLRTRTGRFAESARIVGANVTPQGSPSLAYTYQRSPYDVFDKTLGSKPWNIPGRDPSELIQKTVREIASELAIGRFYMRRA